MESGMQTAERVHGGDRLRAAERLGINPEDLLDFSSSINPFGPPEEAVRAILEASMDIRSYPDQWADRFVRALAEYHSVPAECLMAANGSIEFIHLLSVAFKPRTVALVAPDFCEYELAFCGQGADVSFIDLKRDDGFELDFNDPRLRGAEFLILSNPNNPTGLLFDREALLELAVARRNEGKITVVDEAFSDFAPSASLIGKIEPGLIVLRSMTKFYALAGLRLGYLIADPEHIKALRRFHWPWSANALAIAAGVEALRDSDFRRRSLEAVAKLRKDLFDSLSAFSWLKPYPSVANYLLVEMLGGLRSTDLAWALAKSGILVRDCSSFRGLDDRFIRVAVRTADENSRLLKALKVRDRLFIKCDNG